jgi:hypothetical protein
MKHRRPRRPDWRLKPAKRMISPDDLTFTFSFPITEKARLDDLKWKKFSEKVIRKAFFSLLGDVDESKIHIRSWTPK